VTGIDKLNTTLQAMQTSYQSSQSLQAAGMIGHGVLVAGSNVQLRFFNSVFGLQLDVPADDVQITIRDSSGKAVHSIDLGAQQAGTLPLTWDGTTDSGAAAPDGNYKIEVSATSGGKNVTAVSPLSFGTVASVSTGAQGLTLNVSGAGQVNFSDVKQIL
jgi:flagellar basal-body rod modification protein FlgD